MTSPIEDSIFSLLDEDNPGKSLMPETVARAVDPDG